GFSSEGIHENDDASLASFLGGGDIKVGDRSRFHFLVMATDSVKEIPIDFGTPRDDDHRWKRQGFLAGGRWETRFSPALSITASGSVYDENSNEKDSADPGEAFPYVFEDETKTRKTSMGLTARVTGGKVSETFIGVEFIRDHATDTLRSNYGDTTTAGTTINRSVFLQEEWKPAKGTGLSAGVRVDGNSEAGTEVNPRVAVFQEIGTTGVRLRAAAGRGFRTPTISEKTDPSIGNASLSPEVTMTYEAGADAVLAGGDAVVSATWFYQSFRDLIQYDGTVAGPVGFGELRNSGHAYSRGVEAAATWNFLPTAAAELSYTFTDTWDAEAQRKILAQPTHRGSASLVLTPLSGLTFRAASSPRFRASPAGRTGSSRATCSTRRRTAGTSGGRGTRAWTSSAGTSGKRDRRGPRKSPCTGRCRTCWTGSTRRGRGIPPPGSTSSSGWTWPSEAAARGGKALRPPLHPPGKAITYVT
ncbi:MAG: TonB-dependent receptor for transport vitamin, partial [Deltaproteobacteria bacterium]|nr:TonB-dependent receptor for transport vitamin [Deltaproteobacteria bacterium]